MKFAGPIRESATHRYAKEIAKQAVTKSVEISGLILKAATLFRKPPNAEGDRQSDHDHVHKQSLNKVAKLVRASGMKR